MATQGATGPAGGRTKAWTWRKERFEETFGRILPGRLKENWPAGARLVVLLTFDTQGDVDAAVEGFQSGRWGNGRINYCDLTMRRYDIEAGLPRIFGILDCHGVQGTFLVSGLTAEWYPEDIARLAAAGHEVGAHGHHHVHLCELTPDEEREEIQRATDAVGAATGRRPRGWRSPAYTTTEHTLDILRDLGYLWHSDFRNRDFPFVFEKDGRPLVEVPAGHDDWSQYLMQGPGHSALMGGTPYGTPDGVWSAMKAEFDLLYEEAAAEPRVLQWCMHPKISGRPFRAAVLDRFIAYAKTHSGVLFTTCGDVAARCLGQTEGGAGG